MIDHDDVQHSVLLASSSTRHPVEQPSRRRFDDGPGGDGTEGHDAAVAADAPSDDEEPIGVMLGTAGFQDRPTVI